MPSFRSEVLVTEFLRDALAGDDVGVPKLDMMARTAGLLGERQSITHIKAFKRAKKSLGIRSRRTGGARPDRAAGLTRRRRRGDRIERGSAAVHESACGIVSRVTPVHTALRNCTRDEGRPFEVGNQVLISSHRKLLSSVRWPIAWRCSMDFCCGSKASDRRARRVRGMSAVPPIAPELVRCSDSTKSAMNGLVHCSIQHRHSINSSARDRNDAGAFPVKE